MIELKYKTFDSLLADVMVDFKTFNQENLIEPQELIRVAKWVNSDLTVKIYKTKQAVLELEHGKVRLPYDFHLFNYGLLCAEGSYTTIPPQGVNLQQIPYPSYSDAPVAETCQDSCDTTAVCGGCNSCDLCCPGVIDIPGYNPLKPYGDTCISPRVFLDCKNNAFELVQVLQTETRYWKKMLPLRLIRPNNEITACCPNLYSNASDMIWIKDGFLHSSFKTGTVYINYMGMLENEDGELLVLDHDKITPYYEYTLKKRILENLFINGEDVERRLAYINNERKIARIEAWKVVRMPDFREFMELRSLLHKSFNARYVDMFKANSWINGG